MENKRSIWSDLKGIIATIGGFVGWALGGGDGMLLALVALVAIDYITCLLCGVVSKNLAEYAGVKVIANKIFIFVLVAVGFIIDTNIIGEGSACRMSLELLQCIEQAEAKAEEIRQKAQQDARELLKSIEEACAAKKQLAAKEHRALLIRELENARNAAFGEIQKGARESASKRGISREEAQDKLQKAAELIVERVVRDVHR